MPHLIVDTRCLDIESGRIYIARHAKFVETTFPFQNPSRHSPSVDTPVNNPWLHVTTIVPSISVPAAGEILDCTTHQNLLDPKGPAVIAIPSPGCNGTLLAQVFIYEMLYRSILISEPPTAVLDLHIITLKYIEVFKLQLTRACHCCSSCHGDDDESVNKENYRKEFVSRNVHLITTTEKWNEKVSEASRDGKIAVVNFSALWCAPCKTIAEAYCELSDKYPSVMFLTVDVDELAVSVTFGMELSTSWEIKATPTFFFLKDGRQVDKLVGGNKAELQRKTAAVVNLVSKSRN
ncbi:unnamed protein product [Dovyalis caffra]|uniref:Thioredoxin domain-containing protein n=1 Tax=Dovyalis caffra TaxID=77055 RepID=A0AAV1RXF3_9ROSI|nr:unnamed protein product [Dovyalis caffra]